MKLPRAEDAVVPRNKVENYLLHLEHPIGGGKAKFFIYFGFRRERWEELADALRHHAREHSVTETLQDSDGITYVIEGEMQMPSGRKARVRSIWLVETTELAPRFISAYPLPA